MKLSQEDIKRLRIDKDTNVIITNCYIEFDDGDDWGNLMNKPIVLNGYAIVPLNKYPRFAKKFMER